MAEVNAATFEKEVQPKEEQLNGNHVTHSKGHHGTETGATAEATASDSTTERTGLSETTEDNTTKHLVLKGK